MVNPFAIEDGDNHENWQPLINIATSNATPDNLAISLSNIKENGAKSWNAFVEKRSQHSLMKSTSLHQSPSS